LHYFTSLGYYISSDTLSGYIVQMIYGRIVLSFGMFMSSLMLLWFYRVNVAQRLVIILMDCLSPF